MNNDNLNNYDNALNEKEESLKKKIFQLSKMESLVFSDPKLSKVYDNMAEEGEEKYGYHYNETIMNIIFNEYVLNSSHYLYKYKISKPKIKKRRDKSGINQLRDVNVNETTTSASSGMYVGNSVWGDGDLMKGKNRPDLNKPIWPFGKVLTNENYLINGNIFNDFLNYLNENDVSKLSTDNYIVDKTNAFNSETIKSWNNNDTKLELNTIKSGKMDNNKINEIEDDSDIFEESEIKQYYDNIKNVINNNKDINNFDKEFNDEFIDLYKSNEDLYNKIYNVSLILLDDNKINETIQSIINDMESSMALKTGTNNVPQGIVSSNINESVKFLNDLNSDLNNYMSEYNYLNESRKESSLILVDRLGKENSKNFNKDLKNNSSINDVNKMESEIMNDKIEDISKDPQKNGLTIENESEKESFKNVGNSDNLKGNEINKRNLTDDEQKEVDNYRLGLADYKFDNEPSERYEDNMKKDMGDDLYNKRKEKLEIRKNMPLYNKDPQPVKDSELDENLISGKYTDILNKSRIIDFNLNDAKLIDNVNENYYKLDISGLGNSFYSKLVNDKVTINENVVKFVNNKTFYTYDNNVYYVINENNSSNNTSSNIDNMKKLINYSPYEYVNTKNIKNNRGF